MEGRVIVEETVKALNELHGGFMSKRAGMLRIEGYLQTSPAEPAEIAAVALDDVVLVTNPAELFVEYQLDIKARFKGQKIMIAELTNGRIGYVPTRLACALGGYETIETRFNPDAGEQICEASRGVIESLIDQNVTG